MFRNNRSFTPNRDKKPSQQQLEQSALAVLGGGAPTLQRAPEGLPEIFEGEVIEPVEIKPAHHEHGRIETRWFPRDRLILSPLNPRKYFSRRGLAELGQSIRANGQIQAGVVRLLADGTPEVLIGARRFLALAPAYGNVTSFKAEVRQLDDTQALALMLAENYRRQDVSAAEFALGLKQLYESERDMTWKRVMELTGIETESRLFQYTALLNLPPTMLQEFYEREPLPGQEWDDLAPLFNERHGRALLSLQKYPSKMQVLFSEIKNMGYTGQQAARRADELKPAPKQPKALPAKKGTSNGITISRAASRLPLGQRFNLLCNEASVCEDEAERADFEAAVRAYSAALAAPEEAVEV